MCVQKNSESGSKSSVFCECQSSGGKQVASFCGVVGDLAPVNKLRQNCVHCPSLACIWKRKCYFWVNRRSQQNYTHIPNVFTGFPRGAISARITTTVDDRNCHAGALAFASLDTIQLLKFSPVDWAETSRKQANKWTKQSFSLALCLLSVLSLC